MHGVVFVKFWILLDLSHHDDDGRDTGEDAIVGRALVVLPGADEMGDALVKELGVDLDLCHLDGNCATKMAGRRSVVMVVGEEKEGNSERFGIGESIKTTSLQKTEVTRVGIQVTTARPGS